MKEENYKLQYDFKTIMDSWINHEGYPVLNVARDYDSNTIIVSQERFFSHDTVDEKKHNWYVPINIATKRNPDFTKTTPEMWLKDSSQSFSVKANADDWIILNKQLSGT